MNASLFDVHRPPRPAAIASMAAAHGGAGHATIGAAGAAGAAGAWLREALEHALEHTGHGQVIVTTGARVVHANALARRRLAQEDSPLAIVEGRLAARSPREDARLAEAMAGALERGLYRMVSIGAGEQATPLAIVPRRPAGPGEAALACVSLPRCERASEVAMQFFARAHQLTGAEAEVLKALAAGERPAEIAQRKGVQLSTVRTQIGQLRVKTGTHGIGELLRRVAGLPPMMGLVQ
jgi:DNA-binding CsgD family transcriptional regulator